MRETLRLTTLTDAELYRLEQRICDALRIALVLDHELLPSLRDVRKVITELKERRDQDRRPVEVTH